MLEQAVGLDDQIVCGVSLKGITQKMEQTVVAIRRALLNDFERIVDGNRVEDGVQIVIAIGAARGDLQTDVYFGIWEEYHNQTFFLLQKYAFSTILPTIVQTMWIKTISKV